MATKCQSREREAQAMDAKCVLMSEKRRPRLGLLSANLPTSERGSGQSADFRERLRPIFRLQREAQAKVAKCTCADVREKEAQTIATRCQSADVRERGPGYGK